MGEQTWADAQTQTLIVPIGFPYEYALYPVSRSGRHASALVVINPLVIAGEPQFTVPRENLDSEIYQVIHRSAIQEVHTRKGYVTTDSFKFWFENSFLPHLRILRIKHQYEGPALLIMDNYGPHFKALEGIELQKDNLLIHPLVAHTSDQCQPLDIGFFSITKQFDSNYRPNPKFSNQSNQLIKIYHSLSQACTAKNCSGAFRAIGIMSEFINDNGIEREVAYLDVTKCTKIRDYQISHIQELIENENELTPNQIMIWEKYYTEEQHET